MRNKLWCPVFVFIQGACLCLHLCLFVHVMFTSAPAASLFQLPQCVVVCFTSVGHKSPHCQPSPPKRVAANTLPENSYLPKCDLSNSSWSAAGTLSQCEVHMRWIGITSILKFGSQPHMFWIPFSSNWQCLKFWRQKWFRLQFAIYGIDPFRICSPRWPLSSQKSHSLVSECSMISH